MTHTGDPMSLRHKTIAARLTLICVALALTTAAFAQPPSHGPAKGYLLISGGGTEHSDYQRFIDLAGGKSANIVVIPNASVDEPTAEAALQQEYCGPKSPFADF